MNNISLFARLKKKRRKHRHKLITHVISPSASCLLANCIFKVNETLLPLFALRDTVNHSKYLQAGLKKHTLLIKNWTYLLRVYQETCAELLANLLFHTECEPSITKEQHLPFGSMSVKC
jgi:hypothetical protein